MTLRAIALFVCLVCSAVGASAQTATPTSTPTTTPTRTSTSTPTSTPSNTPTITSTPVPDVSGLATRIRKLDHLGAQIGPGLLLGQRLSCMWHGRHSGGALTAPGNSGYSIAAGTYGVVGVEVTGAVATPGPTLSGITTDGTHYRKVAVCIQADGTYTVVSGVAATGAQANALKPTCPDYAAEVGYLELPVSFTGASTTVTSGMLKQADACTTTLAAF